MGQIIDMTNWVMKEHGVPDSKWTVLHRDENNPSHNAYWICQCECGNICSIRGTALRTGSSKSCGCWSPFKIDMTGWIMKEHSVPDSRLTVLREVPHYGKVNYLVNDHSAYWECQCECGETLIARGTALRAGEILSCGCLRGESRRYDLTNQHFGRLTAKRIEGHNQKGKILWECECECGSITRVRTGDLTGHYVLSCGCIKSKGEATIAHWLTENNIPFSREVSFKDFYTEKGGYPRFDFGILNSDNSLNCLLEFQGRQHYDDSKFGEVSRKIDPLKKEYCIKNHISLFEIRYDEDIKEALLKIIKKIKRT